MTPVFCLDAGDAGGNLILIQIEDPSGHPEPDVRACANVLIPLRKLGVLGAIAGETRILDQVLIRDLGVSPEEVEAVIARETAERKRRERLFRSGPPAEAWHGGAWFWWTTDSRPAPACCRGPSCPLLARSQHPRSSKERRCRVEKKPPRPIKLNLSKLGQVAHAIGGLFGLGQ